MSPEAKTIVAQITSLGFYFNIRRATFHHSQSPLQEPLPGAETGAEEVWVIIACCATITLERERQLDLCIDKSGVV
jgi:hypothetical protein